MLIAGIIAGIVIVDVMIMCAIFSALASQWNDLAGRFPAMNVGEPSVRREFQSVRIGMMNLGGSVHIVVDDRAMHLEPTWFLRKLRGRGASIPWDQIELKNSGRGRSARVRVGKEDMQVPRWAVAPLEAPRS